MSQRIEVGTSSIVWEDVWHTIVINGYLLHLSPTQYRICHAFLTASQRKNNSWFGDLMILAYRSLRELQEETKLSHTLLIKHISNMNTRLSVLGLELSPFQAGYVLIFSSSSARGRQ